MDFRSLTRHAGGADHLVELGPEHPGFQDAVYRDRRNTIARIASLAESKIQEAEEAVNVAREHARLKVEEAERVVALAQEEVAAYVEAAR